MPFNGFNLAIGRGGPGDTHTVNQLATHSYRSSEDTITQILVSGYFPAYLGDPKNVILNDLFEIQDSTLNTRVYRIEGLDPIALAPELLEGNVVGPGSSTDNAIARYDGTTGTVIQNSTATIDDFGNAIFNGDVSVTSDVNTDFISELTANHGVYIDSLILKDDSIDTQLANPMTVGPTNASSVEIKRTFFTATGNDPTVKIGSSDSNTNNSTLHLQARADINLFVEADTNGAGANDLPILIATGESNQSMGRFSLDKVTNTLIMDTGTANTLGSDIDISFRTGGDYVSAPTTGTAPNYQGGGATAPVEALRIDGTTQDATFYAGVYLDTITNDDAQTELLVRNSSTKQIQYRNVSTTGNVYGPASSDDNAIARFDGLTGKLIQNSSVTIDDTGNIDTVGTLLLGTSTASYVQIIDLLVEANQLDVASANTLILGGVNTTDIVLYARTRVGSSAFYNNSVALQVSSSTQGFLPPRMTTAQRTAIATPAPGLMVYDTDENQWYGYNGTIWAILG